MFHLFPTSAHSLIRCLAVAILLMFLPLIPTGCATVEDARAAQLEAVTAREHLASNIAALESALATLPDGDPSKAAAAEALASFRTTHNVLSAAISEVNAAIAHAQSNPDDTLIGTLADAVPGPWRAPLLLGGAGFALFIRARQLKEGVKSIARGIEIAKRDDDSFRDLFAKHANTFRSVQSPVARRIVDEVTGAGRQAGKPGSSAIALRKTVSPI